MMPLSEKDRKFLGRVGLFKIYVILMAAAVLLFLIVVPYEHRTAMWAVEVALCGVFWVTQRLLSYISLLDFEITRLMNVLKHTLTLEQRKELFPGE